MKPGNSSLNPYAASYVPLSKREDAENKVLEITSDDSNTGDTAVWSAHKNQKDAEENQFPGKTSLDYNVCGIEELLNSLDLTKKSHMVGGSRDSWSCSPSYSTEKHNPHDDYEMDLAYLQSMFPSISAQSLADVYSANAGDLEASVDMLRQLENPADDSPESPRLPDTLDIGDVPDEGPSIRLKNTRGSQRIII
ncbi:PREDICTED: polyadenylate-binding protein-interacting protein 6-like [Nelumbo nucifera]|uniref:Polyadenylate-binding protein-interacting protein 6-like n=1 Tax=Nelumbo nucifera TaxID=4432 RepID=A0A1U7ZJR5_NELNU|nr:PREDICTED: polyadenylate-binding protein-interacting protein 6-like [Nelumbo nucifera]